MQRHHCPACSVELRVGTTINAVEDGAPVTIQQLICPNPKCTYNKAKAPVKILRHKLETGTLSEELKLCCDTLLTKQEDTAFFVPEKIEHSIKDGMLSVKCPVCGKVYSFDVAKKEQIS